MKKILVLLMGFILGGCSGMTPITLDLKSWEGAPLTEVTRHWGPPSSVTGNSGGITFYSWDEDRGGAYTYGGAVKLTCRRTLGVNDDDVVTSWSWTGNSCYGAEQWRRPTKQPVQSLQIPAEDKK